MKQLTEIINEASNKGEWCVWDYKENGVHEILLWKGNGKDQSDISEIDEHGKDLMNVNFETAMEFIKDHKDDKVDKFHLDFSNAKWDKIKDIF